MIKTTPQAKTGFAFLWLALFAFMGLGLEMLLAFLVEPLLWGKGLGEFNTTEIILHWVFTCLIWGASAAVLLYIAKRKLGFTPFSLGKPMKPANWIACFALLAFCVAVSVWDWNGLKVLKEFAYNGWLKFIFQYIYYIFETFLVVLIVIFGQHAGEAFVPRRPIPWGGILAGLTWGLVHMLTKGDLHIGLLSCLFAVLFGVFYLLANKQFWISFGFIFLAFVL